MLRRFRDPLTYPDLAGRRKLRGYVLAALIILVIAAGIFVLGQSQQADVQTMIEATPRPVSQVVQSIPTTQTPTSISSPTPEGCPDDPDQWVFKDVFPGDHYKRIAPSRELKGLAKTDAWHMLDGMGPASRLSLLDGRRGGQPRAGLVFARLLPDAGHHRE